MRARFLGLALFALVGALVVDIGLTLFVLPGYWRPLPPFGPLVTPGQRAWFERQRRELESGAPETGIGMFDPELGWNNRPSSASPDGKVHFDSLGCRGSREYPERPAPGTLRVATFGDSFTFCQEVADPYAWQAILEGERPDTEVLNLGVGGFGTDQALLRARRRLPGLHADVAWLGLLLENIGRNVNRYRPLWYPRTDVAVAKPRFVLAEDGALELLPSPFRTRGELVDAIADGSVLERLREHEYWADDFLPAALRWSAIARILAGRQAYAARSLPRLWGDVDGEPFRVTLALLEEFVALARRSGVEHAAVLVFAMEQDQARWRRDGRRYWTTLLDALEERRIPYVDLSAPVGEVYRAGSERPLFHGAHHSRLGNTIVAGTLDAWLERHVARAGGESR